MANTKSENRIQSIQDLNKKSQVNFSSFTLKNLFNRLNSLRDQGKDALKHHKEEDAYIYFRRWQNCVEHIKNCEIKSGKRTYSFLVSEKDVIFKKIYSNFQVLYIRKKKIKVNKLIYFSRWMR